MDIKEIYGTLRPHEHEELAGYLSDELLAAEAVRRGLVLGSPIVGEQVAVVADSEQATNPKVKTTETCEESNEVEAQFEEIIDRVQGYPYSITVTTGNHCSGVNFYRNGSYSRFSAISAEYKEGLQLDKIFNKKTKQWDMGAVERLGLDYDWLEYTIDLIQARRNPNELFRTRIGDRGDSLYYHEPSTTRPYDFVGYEGEGVTETLTIFPASLQLGSSLANKGVSILDHTTVRDYSAGGDNRRGQHFSWNILMPDGDAEAIFAFLEEHPDKVRDLGERLIFSPGNIQDQGSNWINEGNWRNSAIPIRPPYEQWQEDNGGVSKIAFRRARNEVARDSNIVSFTM